MLLDAASNAVIAVVLAVGLVFVSYVVAWRINGNGAPLTRWLIVVAGLYWIPTALFHALAPFRLFTLPAVLLSIALLHSVAVIAAGGRSRVSRWLERDRALARRVTALVRRSPYKPAALIFAACAAPALLRALVLPPLGWDTLTYHAVKAAMWVQSGGSQAMEGPGPWAYYRDMLAGGEVFIAWAMLPFHADALVPVIDVLEWLTLGAGLIVLARQLGIREPYASAAAAFVMALPPVRLMLGTAYVDLCVAATFVAGIAIGLAAIRRPARLVAAGGLLGISAAAKFLMIPATLAALAILGAAVLRRRAGTVACVAACASYAVALAPWMILAAMRTGAPFSPVPAALGHWALGYAPPELVWYLKRPTPAMFQLDAEIRALRGIFSFPGTRTEALGVFALLPIGVSLYGAPLLVRRSPIRALAVVAAAVLCIAAYYSNGFSAVRHYWSINSSRFLVPAVALLTVVSLSWCRGNRPASQMYRRLLLGSAIWNLVQYTRVGSSPASIQAAGQLAVAAAIVAIACVLAARLPRPRAATPMRLVLCLAGLAALLLIKDPPRNDLFAREYTLHPFGASQYWAAVLPAVDEPNASRRVAVTSGPWQNVDNWFAYPLMGRRLQNQVVYVPISADGQIRHFGDDTLNVEFARAADFEAWLGRLRDQGVTDVMSFDPPSIEIGWMESHPELFERVVGLNGVWGLFRLRH